MDMKQGMNIVQKISYAAFLICMPTFIILVVISVILDILNVHEGSSPYVMIFGFIGLLSAFTYYIVMTSEQKEESKKDNE